MKQILIAAVLIVAAAVHGSGQQTATDKSGKSGELFDAIARMDGVLFDAFNAHDAKRLMTMFTDDLEFFDDSGGLTDYRQTGENFKKMFGSTPDIRRNLVPGSLEVYPVKDYGAIEVGQHRFCHKENGKEECGTFRFAIVWRKSGDLWQISRLLSYGH